MMNQLYFYTFLCSIFISQLYHANISEATPGDFVPLDQNATFYYSVLFIALSGPEQIDQDDSFEFQGESHIQWLPIILKFALILTLSLMVFFQIARMLRRDFIQLTDDEEKDMNDLKEEVGWKLIRTEALMPPKNRLILSSCIGTGIHFIILTLAINLLGVLGIYYGHKGSIKTSGLVIYAFTGYFNGYYAGKYYKFLGGNKWVFSIVLTAALFPASMISTWIVVNSLAWYMDSTAAIPFKALFFVGFLWAVVYLPLTLIGGVSGRLRTIDQIPYAISKRIQKSIPPAAKYQSHLFQFLYAGLLPFCSILIEVNYVLSSTWGHYTFHLYGMIFLALILLLLEVGCITILQTYMQLNRQDYTWWWSSYINGGSIALYLFVYCIFYFGCLSEMHGLIQTSFYFAYSFLACVILFLMFGAFGFQAALKFVFYIYKNCKSA